MCTQTFRQKIAIFLSTLCVSTATGKGGEIRLIATLFVILNGRDSTHTGRFSRCAVACSSAALRLSFSPLRCLCVCFFGK